MKHPNQVLLPEGSTYPVIAVCDHYAGSEKLMLKSMQYQAEKNGAFDITFDCEDGASVLSPEQHVQMASELLASRTTVTGNIGIRVHDTHSPHFANDIETVMRIAGNKVAYITVPKISSTNDASIACDAITHFAHQYGVATPPIHVLIETHGALREVFRIAAHPAIHCLSFGLMDFVSSHRGAIDSDALTAKGQFEHPLITRAKLEVSAACHAYGKTPSHNVITELSQPDVVAKAALQAKKYYAYTRMWSIHPSQINPILQAFLPTADEISTAEEIIAAAAQADWGPIRHTGTEGTPQLHDRASYRYYWNLIERAFQANLPLQNDLIVSFLK